MPLQLFAGDAQDSSNHLEAFPFISNLVHGTVRHTLFQKESFPVATYRDIPTDATDSALSKWNKPAQRSSLRVHISLPTEHPDPHHKAHSGHADVRCKPRPSPTGLPLSVQPALCGQTAPTSGGSRAKANFEEIERWWSI